MLKTLYLVYILFNCFLFKFCFLLYWIGGKIPRLALTDIFLQPRPSCHWTTQLLTLTIKTFTFITTCSFFMRLISCFESRGGSRPVFIKKSFLLKFPFLCFSNCSFISYFSSWLDLVLFDDVQWGMEVHKTVHKDSQERWGTCENENILCYLCV